MKTIFTCLFVSVALFGFGQQNTFKVRSFAPDISYLNQVVQLDDGSFVAVGDIYFSSQNDSSNIYLLKTDAAGKVLASKSISLTEGFDDGVSLAKTSDGGLIVSGNSSVTAIELLKLNADLSITWQKGYSLAGAQLEAGKVLQAADGGYMVVGNVNGYGDDITPSGGCLIKTDALGNLQFTKQFFNTPDDLLFDMTATTDGGYALLGFNITDNGSFGIIDSSYLIKVDANGNILWSRGLYESATIITDAIALTATSDGGIVVTGASYLSGSDGTGDGKMLMMKYNNAGVLQWSKRMAIGTNTANFGNSVIEDNDGGYVFAGGLYDFSGSIDTAYAYAVKTDKNGSLIWTRAFDKNFEGEYNDIYNLIKTNDGGYAVCGEGEFYNPDDEDVDDGSFLYKLNADFQACNETESSVGKAETGPKGASVTIFTGTLSMIASQLTALANDAGTINNVCNTGALPLQLLSFNATLQNKSVSVNWTTANEVNTDYFVVERSANGSSFTALQKIAAKGNSSITQTYSTNDLQPLSGISYYRLQQVDKDGKTTYSSVVKVVVMSNGTIVISPNPVQSNIRVVVQSSANSNLTLQVMDMKGNVLATQKTAVGEGRNEVNIPAASLAKGVYILKVMDKGSVQTIWFVKE